MPVRRTIPGVYVEEVSSGLRTISGVSTSVTAFVGVLKRGPLNRARRVVGFGEFDSIFGGLDADCELSYSVKQFFLNGGTEALIVRVAADDQATDLIGNQPDKTGMFALDDVDLFNILCIPCMAALNANEAARLITQASRYCEDRRAFLIVDIPDNVKTVAEMQNWIMDNAALRHRNAAVYFPRIMVADPLDANRLKARSASGTMAGVYAHTDSNRGVWKAPAGAQASLQGVQAFEHKLTHVENDVLNPLAVNALRVFPGVGHVCWGARTLDGSDRRASEWKYIPVRRTALFIEESLLRGTQWAVFEPNDEPLWAQIRLNVGSFMQGLFRQGAFQGVSASQAYYVKCDRQTTTQADIDRGIVNIVVGFAAQKPAEFVVIRIQQIAGQ